MPYNTLMELPDSVKDNLPTHAQQIYKEAFNNALNEYGNEEVSHKVAWSAVKKAYHKDESTGHWEEN